MFWSFGFPLSIGLVAQGLIVLRLHLGDLGLRLRLSVHMSCLDLSCPWTCVDLFCLLLSSFYSLCLYLTS